VGNYVFADVEIIIIYVDCPGWTGANALPTEKAFRHVIPYRNRDWLSLLEDSLSEAIKGHCVLYETV